MIKDDIADQLVYSTVKITCQNSSSVSTGTGFFMRKELEDGKKITAIVTNKHVVNGYDNAEIVLCQANTEGAADDENHVTIKVPIDASHCVFHPDSQVDICFVFINDAIEMAESKSMSVFYRCIGMEMTLLEKDIDSITSIEDVIMIGYPSGIMDQYNNKPVVRKGITATSIKLRYDGKPDFLVDIATFPGSSGSPVFLRREGLEKETNEKGLTLGIKPSYLLLGIIHSSYTRKENGEIVVKDITTSMKPFVEYSIPLNLGIATTTDKILELFDYVESISK